MKILLAFALVASAAALVPRPVALPAAPAPAAHDAPEDVQAAHKLAQISIEPLIVPASTYERVERVRVAHINFDQANPEPVQFVDSANFVHPLAYAAVPAQLEAAEEVAEEIEPSPVNFAENIAVAADSEAIEVPAVSYVEPEAAAAVVADAAEIDASPVNFVDFAEVAESPAAVADDGMDVNFVDVAKDAPVPEPISLEAFAQGVADQNDTPQEIPYGKLYDNPMLR